MRYLADISNIIIVVGAIAGAITAVITVLKGPTKFFKKIRSRRIHEELEEVLDTLLPQRFSTMGDDIKNQVLEDIKEQLKEIKNLNLTQNEYLNILNNSLKDVLRERIMNIYNAYKSERKIPIQKKEILDELYNDYKEQKGNSYIDKYKARMDRWEVIDIDEYED